MVRCTRLELGSGVTDCPSTPRKTRAHRVMLVICIAGHAMVPLQTAEYKLPCPLVAEVERQDLQLAPGRRTRWPIAKRNRFNTEPTVAGHNLLIRQVGN